MKRYLHPQNFESFLRETTDDLRMYPGDNVWRNINKSINAPTRWPVLYISAVTICLLVLTSILFVHPDERLFAKSEAKPEAGIAMDAVPQVSPTSTFRDMDNFATGRISHPQLIVKNSVADVVGRVAVVEPGTPEAEYRAPRQQPAVPMAAAQSVQVASARVIPTRASETITSKIAGSRLDMLEKPAFRANHNIVAANAANVASNNITSPSLPQTDYASAEHTSRASKANKWETRYYFAPTISYRMLKEEPVTQPGNTIVMNPASLDIKDLVKHRPALGMELGIQLTRNIASNVFFNTGLVVGYRNYVISAYRSPSSITDLTLNQGNRIDTLSVYTELNNFGGSQPKALNSSAFQIGVPVGLMVRVGGLGNHSLLLSTTLQPTVNLSKSGWLISTDHSHYVNMPDMMRKFNLNAGVGVFYQYESPKSNLTWQVGPQVRYQTMSSALNSYPVQEHPIDYGFRVAIGRSKN